MNITTDFKTKVITELKDIRTRYGGSDSAFAKQWSMNSSVWSRLKNGETEGLLKDAQWLNLGRELNVSLNERKWNMAKTEVFEAIKSDVEFCQNNSKGIVLVDDCAIGKTYTGKYLAKTMNNCFYVDGSQCKTKSLFIRAFAKAVGVDHLGRIADIKANIKYYLRMLENPVVIIDEAGDLEYTAFLELKEFWNATEAVCGWYLMGADGLKAKMERGIAAKKVGYRELLSRYSDKYMKIIPTDRQQRLAFYKKMISDVLAVNISDKSKLPTLVNKCLATDASGDIGGLRRAETLLILNNA
ncbi:ATP-binding protein [Belliella sp. DSM 107340]|uniref:ATP-binding protein n=1 Tax=Belliella calami TaxID=2923436 RepID=A0ABS9UU10_9BACT|nr:ATP-binding protein [Belliella calami]MCH7400094.1 ATP-binding protein [Belliella calami]